MAETCARHEAVAEARKAELRWLSEVEKIAGTREREIEIIRGQLREAERKHSCLLKELAESAPTIAATSAEEKFASAAIPIIVGIDIEPDSREVDRNDPRWEGAALIFERLPELRKGWAGLAGTGRMALTWFARADPQIEIANGAADWALEQFSDHWRAIGRAGDEIGLHMHPWRWNSDHGRWLQDHADEGWLSHCLDTALSAYRQYFGKAPTCYKGGDRFISDSLLRQLEAAGVEVDLSVERLPGVTQLLTGELADGRLPSCESVPVNGYRPSSEDFRKPDPARKSGLGMLPLTSYPAGTLHLWMPSDDFQNALRLVLRDRASLSHLAFAIRCDLILKGEWQSFCQNMETLAGLVRTGGFQFTTATEAWHRVRDDNRFLGADS